MCEREEKRSRKRRKSFGTLEFEKSLCLKQRKRAALVEKIERSPVNFKFVSSHPKIVFFEATFGQKWSKVRVAVVRKVVARF